MVTTPSLGLLGQAYGVLCSGASSADERLGRCVDALRDLTTASCPSPVGADACADIRAGAPALVAACGKDCVVDASAWTENGASLRVCVQIGSQTSFSQKSACVLEGVPLCVLADAADVRAGRTVDGKGGGGGGGLCLAQSVCEERAVVLGICPSAAETWLPRNGRSASAWADALCDAARDAEKAQSLAEVLQETGDALVAKAWTEDEAVAGTVLVAPASTGYGFVKHSSVSETNNEVRFEWKQAPVVLLPSSALLEEHCAAVATVCLKADAKPSVGAGGHALPSHSSDSVEQFLTEFTVASAQLLRKAGVLASVDAALQCRVGGLVDVDGSKLRVLRLSTSDGRGSSNDTTRKPHVLLVAEPALLFFFPEVRHAFKETPFVSRVEVASYYDLRATGQQAPVLYEQKRSDDAWADLPLEVFRSEALKRALPTACFASWAAEDAVCVQA